MRFIFLLCVLGLSTVTVASHAAIVELEAVKDNTLFESETGSLSSGSGPALFVGANSGLNVRRALLAFDVAAHVPEGAVIEHVELRLSVSNAPNDLPRVIEIHAVLDSWGEGTSSSSGGGGDAATPGDATWLHRFYPDMPWALPGGEFHPQALASTSVTTTGVYLWTGLELVADVQRMLDEPASDFGWILVGEELEAASARRIDSREAPEPGTRPGLHIVFSTDSVPLLCRTWGQIKALYGAYRTTRWR